MTPKYVGEKLVRQTLQQIIVASAKIGVEEAVSPWRERFSQIYADSQARSRTPEAAFGEIDEAALTADLDERLHGPCGIAAFLRDHVEAIRGLVKEAVENYATNLTGWPELIATGGDAEKLFEGWELVHAISPDLTLYGIALAYARAAKLLVRDARNYFGLQDALRITIGTPDQNDRLLKAWA